MTGAWQRKRAVVAWAVTLSVAAAAWRGAAAQDTGDPGPRLLAHTTAIAYQHQLPEQHLAGWRKRVPDVKVIQVPSTIDGQKQRVLFYDSGSEDPKPLLVVLHSWSADYRQNLDIPFAEFAIANDWAFIHPDFRGPNARPEATASRLAVQDVLDAVATARKRAAIDASRIYLVGYSGGGMKALVLAGRHPELWAAVATWGGIYEIGDWYRENEGKEGHYRWQIEASCHGAPDPGTPAAARCHERSPAAHLSAAAGRVPVLIGHGIDDRTVPPAHAVRAFEELAAPADRFSDAERAQLAAGKVPPELAPTGKDGETDPLFDQANAPVRLVRRSQAVTLVFYKGGHDMVYNAALRFFTQHRRQSEVQASAIDHAASGAHN
jgi:dipeptidyl aminopeptidase/acylaminoacyl peptidase